MTCILLMFSFINLLFDSVNKNRRAFMSVFCDMTLFAITFVHCVNALKACDWSAGCIFAIATINFGVIVYHDYYYNYIFKDTKKDKANEIEEDKQSENDTGED